MRVIAREWFEFETPNWKPDYAQEVRRVAIMVQVADRLTDYDGKIDPETKARIILYLKGLKLPGYEKDGIQDIVRARIEENKNGISTYERGLQIVRDMEEEKTIN